MHDGVVTVLVISVGRLLSPLEVGMRVVITMVMIAIRRKIQRKRMGETTSLDQIYSEKHFLFVRTIEWGWITLGFL
jgi:hypothetical protein